MLLTTRTLICKTISALFVEYNQGNNQDGIFQLLCAYREYLYERGYLMKLYYGEHNTMITKITISMIDTRKTWEWEHNI